MDDQGHVSSSRTRLISHVCALRRGGQHLAMWQPANRCACEWAEALTAAAIRLPHAAAQPLCVEAAGGAMEHRPGGYIP